jgi:signal transduction histidine kinase
MQNVNVLGEYNEAFHTLINDYKAYAEIVLIDEDKAKELLTKIQDYEEEEDLDFIISDSLSLLKSTENGIVRVVDIVKNMKTFSHPDEESVHSVDVHEVLESTLLLMKNEIRANVRIVKELNANPFAIKCNRNQLGQIFLNLFMNALQAVPEGADEIILIRTQNDEKNITIDIIDNGCGIAEDKIKLIFDPFYTSKEVGEGTGMGLSISYGIVKKHNGKIAVSSALGKGTKFSLQFPLEY